MSPALFTRWSRLLAGALDEVPGLALVAHVGGDRDGAAAVAAELLGEQLDAVGAPGSERDGGTLLRGEAGGGLPDAGARARDGDDGVLEGHAVLVPVEVLGCRATSPHRPATGPGPASSCCTSPSGSTMTSGRGPTGSPARATSRSRPTCSRAGRGRSASSTRSAR